MFSQRQVSMEVTALCIRQLINVLVLLPAQVQHSFSYNTDATFPRIVPSRLQLFEYQSVFINCEGFFNDLIEWRVKRKIKGVATICSDKWELRGPCDIKTAFSADSGEYWCEAAGKKSNTVNIVVTAGPVILESPALPVMEGEAVTLSCRNKKKMNSKTEFYKDGVSINTGSAGELTIHSISKTDEGLYKCDIPGVGQSAESWLAVRAGAVILESPALPVTEGEAVILRCRSKTTSSNFTADFYKDGRLMGSSSTGKMTIRSVSRSDEGLYKCNISRSGESAESWLAVRAFPAYQEEALLPARVFTLLQMVVVVLLVALLLVLAVAVLHYMKQKGASTSPPTFPTPSPQQTETAGGELQENTLAVFTTPVKQKAPGASSAAWIPVPSASTNALFTEEDHYYYTIELAGEFNFVEEKVV